MHPPKVADAADAGTDALSWLALGADLTAYQRDLAERILLFLDTLRERADQALEHEAAGLPPVLAFDYETILDARRFDPPANYALLRVVQVGEACLEDCLDPSKPPVMVMDPRAGHGPGIGGFHRESEVGIALHEGHPVYFVSFFPEPVPGQTLAHVLHALRRFVEHVASRHDGRAPVLYGNCQAGWAATLLAADCKGLAGPVLLNGSPLSYWEGGPGVNPLRLMGGLTGGTWATHFLADLGDGRLDGAWLVQNFENLQPEKAIFAKYADLFADPDGGRERFLAFERWWNGFYKLGREEIVAIVEDLFVGNRLQEGLVRLCAGCMVDLRRIESPLVVFSSFGDNITPPAQSLGWLRKVYPSTEALAAAGKRVVYLTHPEIGHLGIFESAKVARLQHRAILESLGRLTQLAPGLYEMLIDNPTGDPDCRQPQYSVHFEPRWLEELPGGQDVEDGFERVRAVSELLELVYRIWGSPMVRSLATPASAAALSWLHPMRAGRWIFSGRLNPMMRGIADLAPLVRAGQQPLPPEHPFRAAEHAMLAMTEIALGSWRGARDAAAETTFKMLFGGPSRPTPSRA
jgi:hypothetical protein